MLRSQTPDVLVSGPLQLDLDVVLAVGREEIRHRRAAPRPERQVFAHAVFLHHPLVDPVLVEIGRRGPSNHESADHAGRRQIALHQHRRDRENVRVVVEPVHVRVVTREQRPAVDLEAEQVTDSVDVFRPVQTMDRGPARIGVRRRRAVERGLQPGWPPSDRDNRVAPARLLAPLCPRPQVFPCPVPRPLPTRLRALCLPTIAVISWFSIEITYNGDNSRLADSDTAEFFNHFLAA